MLFQAAAQELYVAIQRLPSLSDLQFLSDPTFIANSVSGVRLAYPGFTALLFLSFMIALLQRAPRLRPKLLLLRAATGMCLLVVQMELSRRHEDVSVASRYNPLHWFVRDALFSSLQDPPVFLTVADLPPDLQRVDLSGTLLLEKSRGKNVLIVVMEGLTGLYHPEIRQAMGVKGEPFTMQSLADATPIGMLVPDFVTHSHQTIRGLYSLLCGDFSKFSFETPKAFELQQHPNRAGDCLPARIAEPGWSTLFLQAGISTS